ncbi:sensor domain-containing protein [Mycolicibacterium llatzerense]|uniref:sensor domain-containing protein n=1 Tax=Mycolicibacterium llatzerense TaxID=280871 RepID=UPI0005B83F5B|nr:sensor domain-containing protein [Mycolicibacterium llatzerense]
MTNIRSSVSIPLVATMLIAACFGTSGCGRHHRSQSSNHSSQTEAAEPANTRDVRDSGPIAEDELESLLLTADQMSRATGIDGLTAEKIDKTLDDKSRVTKGNVACKRLFGASPSGYADATAMRSQVFDDSADSRRATNSVTLYPSAHGAAELLEFDAKSVKSCANKEFTVTFADGQTERQTISSVSETDGVLTNKLTYESDAGDGKSAEAQMAVDNVIIYAEADTVAIATKIVKQIADNLKN